MIKQSDHILDPSLDIHHNGSGQIHNQSRRK